jgi:2-dehydropantoate 2-reductase
MGKKIAIVGAGAVGGYTGAHIVRSGEDVTFIDPWPEHVEHMRRHGLRVTHAKDVPEFTVPVRALYVTDAQSLAKEKPVDVAFVCMKSYDTAWAATLIRQYLAPDGYVVSLQNCMNEETIAGVVGWGKTMGCIASSITVNLSEPGHIHRGAGKGGAAHTAYRTGEVHGRVTARAEEVCRLVGTADSAKVTANLWGERWSKLVANVMGNGLSAATGLTSNQILDNGPARRFSTRLGSEAIRVGQALGYALEEILHLPPETLARAGEGDTEAEKNLRCPARQRCEPSLVRAAPFDGPGHAEGEAHRNSVPQRLGGAGRREAWHGVPRQRAFDRSGDARRARRAQAGPETHRRAPAELGRIPINGR